MGKRIKGHIPRPCWNCGVSVRFILDGAVLAWMDDLGRHRCSKSTAARTERDKTKETVACDYCAKDFERKLTESWKTKCPTCWQEENRPANRTTGWIRGENYKPTDLCKNCVPPWEVCVGCPDAFA